MLKRIARIGKLLLTSAAGHDEAQAIILLRIRPARNAPFVGQSEDVVKVHNFSRAVKAAKPMRALLMAA
jgi:hypothetical protein